MVGRGRQKTDLRLIEKKESRSVCFSKRRSGLFKKASELSILTGAKTGLIVFSPAGKPYAMDSSFLDSLLGFQMERNLKSSTERELVDDMDAKETPYWWNIPQVEAMNYQELVQFEKELLEYGEKKIRNLENSDERRLEGMQQHGQDVQTLIDSHQVVCAMNESIAPINASLQMELEMVSTFDPTILNAEGWLQWIDELMMET